MAKWSLPKYGNKNGNLLLLLLAQRVPEYLKLLNRSFVVEGGQTHQHIQESIKRAGLCSNRLYSRWGLVHGPSLPSPEPWEHLQM